MTEAQENAAYYAVITAPVRYDPELSSSAKLLYCEITSLCKQKGYCWSTNSYFAELYNLSESTISRLIAKLERRGHIHVETVTVAKGSERRIYTDTYRVERVESENSNGGTQKPQAPSNGHAKSANLHAQKAQRGVRKNRKQNDCQLNDYSESNTPYSPPEGDAPPVDSEPVNNAAPKTKRARQKKSVPTHAPERFEQFWQVYPVGGSRLKAVEAWDALAPSDELIDEMALVLKRQMRSKQWREGIGIPHACRWISNQRWTDKLPEEPRPQSSGGRVKDLEVL